jgi:glycosyltransferase 2 family protein
VQAIYIGLFANGVLPLRSGKWLRAYLVSQWGGVKISQILPTILFEWYFEWTVLVSTVVVTSAFFPFPSQLQSASRIISFVLFGGLLTAVLFGYQKKSWWQGKVRTSESRFWRPMQKAQGFLGTFFNSLAVVARSRHCLFSLLVTLIMPFCQTAALWSLLNAYHISIPFLGALVIFFIINLGTALPNAPGNVGSYQASVTFGLLLFGVDKAAAAEFSMVAFIILSLPYLLIGFIALLAAGINLRDLRPATP